jgi:lysozyme
VQPLNVDRICEQLKVDEGVKYELYNDHLGYLTGGIGHLIRSEEPESHFPPGTKISEERVNEWFREDLDIAIGECRALYSEWNDFPAEVQEILVNMMFNMGRTRLSKFKKMNAHLSKGEWSLAAVEGRDSRWYRQVTNRAERLMSRLEEVS